MLLYIQTIEDPRQARQFEDIYTACRGRLLALARRKLCGGAEAEDAVHQAFLALAEHFPRLCRLPPRCREALLLRYGCGYSTRETAALLDLSFAAAQKLLQRAKAALRTELEKEGISV